MRNCNPSTEVLGYYQPSRFAGLSSGLSVQSPSGRSINRRLSTSRGDTPTSKIVDMADPSNPDDPQADSLLPDRDNKDRPKGEPHVPGMGVPNPEIYPKGTVANTATPIYPTQEPGTFQAPQCQIPKKQANPIRPWTLLWKSLRTLGRCVTILQAGKLPTAHSRTLFAKRQKQTENSKRHALISLPQTSVSNLIRLWTMLRSAASRLLLINLLGLSGIGRSKIPGRLRASPSQESSQTDSDTVVPQTIVSNPDSWAHLVSASQHRAWEEDQARKVSQAVHSARTAKLFGLVTRSRTVALETGHYLMGWNPVGILIGLFGAGGALMLTLALIPETYSPSLYRLAEILFAVSILLFIAKCIYDFRAHEERRLIARGLGVLGVFILIGVIGLFEWNRPTKTPTTPALQTAQPPIPIPSPTPAMQPLVVPSFSTAPTPSASPNPVRQSRKRTLDARQRQLLRDLDSP